MYTKRKNVRHAWCTKRVITAFTVCTRSGDGDYVDIFTGEAYRPMRKAESIMARTLISETDTINISGGIRLYSPKCSIGSGKILIKKTELVDVTGNNLYLCRFLIPKESELFENMLGEMVADNATLETAIPLDTSSEPEKMSTVFARHFKSLVEQHV